MIDRDKTARFDPHDLAPREKECLLWVGLGKTTKEIADRLKLSDPTVDEYIASAMRKLGATSRTQAVAMLLNAGLPSRPDHDGR